MRRIALFLSIGAVVMLLASGAMAGNKVNVCHIPPGNADNAHTISVSERAVDAHLAHGDMVGECAALISCKCTNADGEIFSGSGIVCGISCPASEEDCLNLCDEVVLPDEAAPPFVEAVVLDCTDRVCLD